MSIDQGLRLKADQAVRFRLALHVSSPVKPDMSNDKLLLLGDDGWRPRQTMNYDVARDS